LPEFETIDAANELVGALVMGLWNRLSRHQDQNAPFRLTRIETGATGEELAVLAMLRRQELEGFVEGLFGKEEALGNARPDGASCQQAEEPLQASRNQVGCSALPPGTKPSNRLHRYTRAIHIKMVSKATLRLPARSAAVSAEQAARLIAANERR
jgi:hypothetical protein